MSSAPVPVTIGFVPLLDAALLVVAREEGFAAARGIDLRLVREGSWAAVRDKLNAGLFDAAHMLAPAAVASTLGLGHFRQPLICPVALSLDGNAITVSNSLAEALEQACAGDAPDRPARAARALAALIAGRRAVGAEPVTIGVVFGYSCHLYQVRSWLKLGGIDPERDVRFVVIPPPLMVESLKAGHLDLFCAGAPWNRLAETEGAGRVLLACSLLEPDCLEKLLVLRADRAGAPWLTGLVSALAQAAEFAADPARIGAVARHLSRPDYLGVPADLIESILAGAARAMIAEPGQRWIRLDPDATRPAPERLTRIVSFMRDAGQLGDGEALDAVVGGIMQGDLHKT